MKLMTSTAALSEMDGLLVIGRPEGGAPSALEAQVDAAAGGALSRAAERRHFKGKAGQKISLDLHSAGPHRVLLVGLGPQDELSPAGLRDFAAAGATEALHQHIGSLTLAAPSPESARELAVGVGLGAYRFDSFKAEEPDSPRAHIERVTVAAAGPCEAAIAEGEALARAVNLARELANEPPNVCTPARLEAVAREIAAAPNMSLTVLDVPALTEAGMGGILAVGRGSKNPPRLLHLSYTPPGADPATALAFVGKGLTFDSGGLNVKTAKGMAEMYIDMAGSAAVLGALRAVADLQPDVAVHGIVGAAENMPDGGSYRPSDILTMANGATVEILNTDAEGRLVLADCIHYATQQAPRAIIDLATLTGACMVGLGPNYSGLFTDDETLAKEVLDAGARADERLWRLPLDPKLAKTLDSTRADFSNLGGPYGGAITAAQFLQRFKGETPWLHLDIAGAALAEKADGHIPVGATGFGVLTLWALVGSPQG